MNARRNPSGFGNPVLIGALTVLVVIVAVFLAYNANNGLPFVPSYTLNVQVADASELTHGAEVHMGGALVGFVDSVRAERAPSGQPIAVLGVKLNKSIGPLPVNSTFAIRLKGAIGQKYLAIGLGNSKRTFQDGATVPLGQTSAAVDLDQVLSMFSPPTRKGVVASTVGFSDGLAGRGIGLNDAIGAFVPLLGDLEPVARNLASPHTDLGGFLRGLEAFAGTLAPVAQTQANLFVSLDTTFRALASVSVPYLQDAITDTPPAFNAVIANAPTIRPFLTDSAALFSELRPGIATLPTSAPVLADAFTAGVRNLPGTAALDQRLVSLSNSLATYGADPGGPTRTRPPDAVRLEPALAARVPDAGPIVVQLRDAVPAQHRERAVREHDLGHLAPVLAGRDRRRPRRRIGPVAAAVHDAPDQPDRRARPAPRQSVPEHRLAGRDRRVRGGQRAVFGRGGGHRERPRQPGPPDRADRADRPDQHQYQQEQRRLQVRRHRRRGMSNFAAGLLAALVIAAAVYLTFGGPTPFSASPFVLKAVFTTETELHIPSPVRIAGVDVGEVTSVKPLGGNSRAAVVTMDINNNGLPIHADATAGINTRIFLEGNFYVDLHPGTPNAPILDSGATLPAANTSGPVQLDRVLAALTTNARGNLDTLVQGLGASLNGQPTAAQDATTRTRASGA